MLLFYAKFFESEVDTMAQKRDYATKKKGKTEVYPFWNLEDIKNVVEWFENHEEWDGYLITLLEMMLARRISDTISMRWSDLYYENGNEREEITTIEEMKTGKTVEVPITHMVFEVVDKYCEKMNINPMEHYNEFIFEFKSKTEWINRKNNPVYSENDLEKWCEFLNKDLSDKRKENILEEFRKQKRYKTLGEYLYCKVEWADIDKWHTNAYRNVLNKAIKDCNIQYRVSSHSLRKSFGYWIHQLHPFDPDCLYSISRMLGHATIQQTLTYIGLTKEKNKKYVDNYGNLIKNVLDGNTEEIIKNSPVISMLTESFGNIIMEVIKKARNTDMSDMEIYHEAINEGNRCRV